ncbi:hypothetical protein [Pseudoalteromonas sp. R3]|uniref:hypothetical protein n=1 Tax=Pseudoalteromonas sp. R3 TaxID=1709477 RepID=UPI000FDDAB95|nr:hypothetical protein [Pseudoalteromonas sp. R3]AZZ96231.1 hypothetical protein ELR70_03265 [Pseudoalteromonas sp. R3]
MLIILSIFVWGEIRFFNAITANPNNTLTAEQMQAKLELLTNQRATFRAFWFDTLQLIILNVLFPTLTALLGYVFGTSRNNGGKERSESLVNMSTNIYLLLLKNLRK